MSRRVKSENQQILKILLDRDNTTAAQLAEEIGISEKTVRNRIKEVNALLGEKKLGEIISKPKKGMILEADLKQKNQIRLLLGEVRRSDSTDETGRMSAVLRMILRSIKTPGITINEIADALYISAPTAAKSIGECRDWLAGFHISLETVRNKGIAVKCTEQQYRQAIMEYIVEEAGDNDPRTELKYFFDGLNVDLIYDLILNIEKEWNFRLMDESFKQILTYVCIATVENMNREHNLNFRYHGVNLSAYNEYNFAAKVFHTVNTHLGLQDRDDEIAYLTVQILCARVITQSDYDPVEQVQQYDLQLQNFVHKTISSISDVLNIDLTRDERLYLGLLNHIRALVFRMKYGQPLETRVNIPMQKEFPTVMRVSWLVSTLFEEYFQMSISDDELSYIALYIQSAIDEVTRPVNAVLVTSENSGVTRLLYHRLTRSIPEIQNMKIITMHEFDTAVTPDVDVIISTTDLDIKDGRVVVLKDLFADENIKLVSEKIENCRKKKEANVTRFDAVCHQLFEPDLMMPQVSYRDKESLLKDMCARLTSKGYAMSRYSSTVLAREAENDTSIGQEIAIPHGNMAYTNESKIVVATLKEPIDWGKEKVSVVFLLNILMNTEKEQNKWFAFYKQFIKLTDSETEIEQIKNISNSIDLYYHFIM